MHYDAHMRIKPFKPHLGKNVNFRRDFSIVMAEDEAELLKLATATKFAIQYDLAVENGSF